MTSCHLPVPEPGRRPPSGLARTPSHERQPRVGGERRVRIVSPGRRIAQHDAWFDPVLLKEAYPVQRLLEVEQRRRARHDHQVGGSGDVDGVLMTTGRIVDDDEINTFSTGGVDARRRFPGAHLWTTTFAPLLP